MVVVAAPHGYRRLLGELPDGARLSRRGEGPFELVHLFVTTRAALATQLPALVSCNTPAGAIWVSWPKRAAPKGTVKVPIDVTEDTVRAVALPLGLVDVKVCAVDEVWSGLKLVIRVASRPR